MNVGSGVLLAIAVALGVYLSFVMIRPERF